CGLDARRWGWVRRPVLGGALIDRRGGPAGGEHQSSRGDPHPHDRALSERRKRSRAACVDSHVTALRSPAKENRRASPCSPTTRPTKTVPTGLAAVPPSGPAMPVTASPQNAPAKRATPPALSSAPTPPPPPWPSDM